MKKTNLVVIGIALALFAIPFLWLKPGFVDLGGDAVRWYFVDPLTVIKNTKNFLNSAHPYSYANVPYEFFLYLLLQIVRTPTNVIAFEHGLQLSLSFLGMYWIVRELVSGVQKKTNGLRVNLAAVLSGITYVGLIAKVGWPTALPTLNQTFLNVLIFYLLLRYCLTQRFLYLSAVFFISIAFSANFGLGSAPQLFSFYPLAFVFLYLYMRVVAKKSIPWRGLILFSVLFAGLHAFHLLPIIASLLEKNSSVYAQVFSTYSIQAAGVDYFAANHADSGKISKELFQWWLGKRVISWYIPAIAIFGFLIRKSRLLSVIGMFFALTLFLVAANITRIGVAMYQKLFYIPGFAMFRSFNEKWFFVFAFFYTLLFGVSLFYLFEKIKARAALAIGMVMLSISIYRMYPFLSGSAIRTTLHQSNNVSIAFTLDPDLLDALAFVRALPSEGKVLTVPLTFPYYQIAYGKEGGAYMGPSLVAQGAGRQDYSGFWNFGPYEMPVFEALHKSNTDQFMQLLSLLNVRYIFRNSDTRIMDDFPVYPYLDSGRYASKDQFPLLKNQSAYETLLASLPVKKLYQKGFYGVYEIDNTKVRPLIYIPDYVSSEWSKGLVDSYRWAFGDAAICAQVICDKKYQNIPSLSYAKRAETAFDVQIDLGKNKEPFLLVFSNNYYSAVDLSFQGVPRGSVRHVTVNGYANGWIIDPTKTNGKTVLYGRIVLDSKKYFYIGRVISSVALFVLVFMTIREIARRKYEKK